MYGAEIGTGFCKTQCAVLRAVDSWLSRVSAGALSHFFGVMCVVESALLLLYRFGRVSSIVATTAID